MPASEMLAGFSLLARPTVLQTKHLPAKRGAPIRFWNWKKLRASRRLFPPSC